MVRPSFSHRYRYVDWLVGSIALSTYKLVSYELTRDSYLPGGPSSISASNALFDALQLGIHLILLGQPWGVRTLALRTMLSLSGCMAACSALLTFLYYCAASDVGDAGDHWDASPVCGFTHYDKSGNRYSSDVTPGHTQSRDSGTWVCWSRK